MLIRGSNATARWGATIACALMLGACGTGVETTDSAGDELAGRQLIGEFEGSIDPETGNITLTPISIDDGFDTSAHGVAALTVINDGVAGSGPAESIELVTTATRQGLAGCGRIDSFCGDVTIRSFYTSRLLNVFVQILSTNPTTGFDGFNSDSYTGYSNTKGLWIYGPIEANGGAVSRTWYFNQPGGANFRFQARVYGDIDPNPACTISSCGARGVCVAGACVAGRRVFVTQAAVLPNFGGVAGADAICQAAGTAAGFSGGFMAWVSLAGSNAAARHNPSQLPYYLVNGTRIANDWADLTDGSLQAPINRDQTGAALVTTAWTNTNVAGTAIVTTAAGTCSNFTSTLGTQSARIGNATQTAATWTTSSSGLCNRTTTRLYCFEN
ncbi:hypothetical protein L6R52_36805 [Myxococcota bacterium]|nr:hypothetical protein [Myxococcota bacterium]